MNKEEATQIVDEFNNWFKHFDLPLSSTLISPTWDIYYRIDIDWINGYKGENNTTGYLFYEIEYFKDKVNSIEYALTNLHNYSNVSYQDYLNQKTQKLREQKIIQLLRG